MSLNIYLFVACGLMTNLMGNYEQHIHVARFFMSFSVMIPSRKPFDIWYLECCIIDAEISIFSAEFFNTLHHFVIGCAELIFLFLQPRCQVRNLT